ncbi:septin-10-like isoform X2 [Symsagittifera roscoffensis]|uniref:septin-10-like isoform X2 n=1 Tax=Symsagittifera roscoffensis TaxID=84072 RepID=UPI00307C128D
MVAATSTEAPPVAKLNGPVGFFSLPDRAVQHVLSKDFYFNVMCIGETGIGKTTLMSTLFNRELPLKPNNHFEQSVSIQEHQEVVTEANVRMHLKVIDTCGYGDQLSTETSGTEIKHDGDVLVKYVEDQMEKYLEEELRIKRNLSFFPDPRVHLCLYFITTNGHGLKPLDILTMKKLSDKVNLVPIIAKADTITKPELEVFKKKIREELCDNGIVPYLFPLDDESNEELVSDNTEANKTVPFAVVGSHEKLKGHRVRVYPWGTVNVENEEHCDFKLFRQSVINRNLCDLCVSTSEVHYEAFRKRRLPKMGYVASTDANLSFTETIERERARVTSDLQRREDEMRATFIRRVKDKENELQIAEQSLTNKYNKLKGELEIKKLELEEERSKLDTAKCEFEKAQEERRRMLEEQAAAAALSSSTSQQQSSTATLGRSKKK